VPGRWRLVTYGPQAPTTDRVVEIGDGDDDVVLDLSLE